MLVVLNTHANNGAAQSKWAACQSELERHYLGTRYTLVADPEEIDSRVREAAGRGDRVLIAAGGDGTVNRLLNVLMALPEAERHRWILGAIGLGSSNDFHKPPHVGHTVNGGIPVRLDYGHAVAHNVGRIDFDDGQGSRCAYFLMNASIGVVAEANRLFNSSEQVIRWLKPRWVSGAIWYAALRTLVTLPNIPTALRVADDRFETAVTNAHVLISPYFTGSLSYDLPVSPDGEVFGVALAERMGIRERMRTILCLGRGRFVGLPHTRTWHASRVELHPAELTTLEMDGEVTVARDIIITLLQSAVTVCT